MCPGGSIYCMYTVTIAHVEVLYSYCDSIKDRSTLFHCDNTTYRSTVFPLDQYYYIYKYCIPAVTVLCT